MYVRVIQKGDVGLPVSWMHDRLSISKSVPVAPCAIRAMFERGDFDKIFKRARRLKQEGIAYFYPDRLR